MADETPGRVEEVPDFALVVPFDRGTFYTPPYYRQVRRHPLIDRRADVFDVAHAFGVDEGLRLQALQYLVRAGRKPGESEEKDLTKLLELVQRRLRFLSMEREACSG